MIFTMPALARSLADYLAPSLPDVSFYADPSQQGTASRALFLQQTNARLTKQMGGRFLRRLGLDLVYLEDFRMAFASRMVYAGFGSSTRANSR